MPHPFRTHRLSFGVGLALLVGCGGGPADADTDPDLGTIPTGAESAYEHARACEAELGPVPAFDLSTAEDVPVLLNGEPVDPLDGTGQCDAPAAFQDACDCITTYKMFLAILERVS